MIFLAFRKKAYILSFMDAQEMKERIKKSGLTLKEIAARCGCTPQHLSAIKNGRARLSDKLANKIHSVLQNEEFSSPVYLTIRFAAAEWEELTEQLPENIDIQETVREYIWWLSGKYYLAKMPKSERQKHVNEETKAGFPPYDDLPIVFLAGKESLRERIEDVPFTRKEDFEE